MPALQHERGENVDEREEFAAPVMSSGVLASNDVPTATSTVITSRKTRATSMSAVATSTSAAVLAIGAMAP
jgi:protein-L-isoaspartate O-methyltransferase